MEQFNDIYQQQYAAILRLVSQFSVNRHEAEDIVQEVFVKLYMQYQTGTIVHYPKTWLYKVATNMCLNAVSRKRDSISVEHASAQSVTCNDCIQTTIEENEQRIIIQTALSKLKKQERLLVVLYSEGLSYKEISEISNIKFCSVSKSLSRSLDKLKLLLNTNYNELPNK